MIWIYFCRFTVVTVAGCKRTKPFRQLALMTSTEARFEHHSRKKKKNQQHRVTDWKKPASLDNSFMSFISMAPLPNSSLFWWRLLYHRSWYYKRTALSVICVCSYCPSLLWFFPAPSSLAHRRGSEFPYQIQIVLRPICTTSRAYYIQLCTCEP